MVVPVFGFLDGAPSCTFPTMSDKRNGTGGFRITSTYEKFSANESVILTLETSQSGIRYGFDGPSTYKGFLIHAVEGIYDPSLNSSDDRKAHLFRNPIGMFHSLMIDHRYVPGGCGKEYNGVTHTSYRAKTARQMDNFFWKLDDNKQPDYVTFFATVVIDYNQWYGTDEHPIYLTLTNINKQHPKFVKALEDHIPLGQIRVENIIIVTCSFIGSIILLKIMMSLSMRRRQFSFIA